MDNLWMPALFVLVVLAAVVGVVQRWRQGVKTRKAMLDEPGGDRCVACQSTQVDEFAAQAFRCKACGFEWGEGLKTVRKKARRAAVAAMSEAERRTSGLADLKQAQVMLLAAKGHIDSASELARQNLRVGYDNRRHDEADRDERKQQAMVVAVGEVKRGHVLIEDAKLKLPQLAGMIGDSDVDVDLGGFAFQTDSILGIGDSGVAEEIERLEAHVSRLVAELEQALARLR